MTRKGSALTLSVSEHEKAQLEQLALTFGQTWGSKPNISKLIKSIANGEIRVAANHDWSRGRIDALNRIRNLCVDFGWLNEARAIAELLLERSEVNLPLRQEVQAFLDKANMAWRLDLDRCILAQRPFRLTYQDAAGRVLNFTIRHAKIVTHEDRQYLDCWCEETEARRDIPATVHNWSLRLDRIPAEAVISTAKGHWQPKLDFVDVEFWLLNDLAFSYRSKTQADLVNEWLAEQQVRRILRRVNHTFWFFREIRRYGANCIVIGPEEVRSRFADELLKMAKHYQSS
jgi:hypothetical protein